MGEYIAVRVEDDETVESIFDLYSSHVSTIQLYLEKEDVDNISIQGNDEVQTHGHIDDNLHTKHYEYQQPSGIFTRMLNDDVDSTRFYSANERDVWYKSYDYTLPTDYNPWSIGYGGGSSQYPFMPITDPSHTFHSASSSGHHVIEEDVIEVDEEDEIDSQNDIDDNVNMDEGDDEPLFDIVKVNNTEIEYEQDPPDIFTSDQWIDEAMLNNYHKGIDVPFDIGLYIEVLHCNLHLVAGKVVVHVADAFICIWIRIKKGHLITIVVIVANQNIIEIHVQGYNPLIIIRASQILTDKDMLDAEPPQSTVGVGIAIADSKVGLGNGDFGVGNANVDSKVAICNVDSEADIANADSMLASGLPVTRLPTWQLGDYFGN
ncbi:hypothetical protein Taro_043000 [Colocasia esculenta]|uniref:Uncharacterized protein n=1 Tax=Colocasia esculenta TaxID=4460 RepID=A0A843WZQ7_COLES|nr:hypothetical protein [Colocasia esculenta]